MNVTAGIMLSEVAFANIPVIFKNSGLDFFILDCEHGAFDYSDISKIITCAKLCNIKSIVRIPDNGRRDIIRLLDMGADALLLPMTNSADDIAQVVKYAKYPPMGARGISTMRAHTLYDPPSITKYTAMANKKTEIYAQIETAAGVDNAMQILSVEGVTGCMMGPNDLSADYNCLGDSCSPLILSAIERVGKACISAGKTAGIITANSAYGACARQNGFTAFCKGSELNAIAKYCKDVAREIKQV